MNRCLALLLLIVTSCAMPRSHQGFSLSSTGISGEEVEFASSQDLFVAGLVSEGLSFAKSGRLYDAEKRLRQAMYREPSNPRIAFNVAVIINQTDQSDEALALITSLLAKEPRNPNYLQVEADIWAAKGDHEKARERLKQAFGIFKGAGNAPRAALLARSIANLAFGGGNEQEALCYSYEALSLAPSPAQSAFHARLLVALNLFRETENFVKSHKGSTGEPLSYHALAMARYALGDYTGALEAEDNALGRIAQSPELSQEVTAAWWLMRLRVPGGSQSDAIKEKMSQMKQEVIQYFDKKPYEVVMWPPDLRRELVKVSLVER